MKIFIDIGHPAHVHYFKNFINIMKNKGHDFCITARDKEVTFNLLRECNIEYKSRGKGGKGIIKKLLYIPKADWLLYKTARNFNPDIFLSFASPYAAHASKLLGKHHIAFDDTEHAKFGHWLYAPFTDAIVNPTCFSKRFSKKQIYFNGYMELCYLHPNYFKPSIDVLKSYKIEINSPFVILRFVSWNANHDIGHKGLTYEYKKLLVTELEKICKVYISSEEVLKNELGKYQIKIASKDLHHFLNYATLYIGEGSTTASESVVLGTPAIYVNPLTVGYCKEQDEKYGLCFHYKNQDGVLEKAIEIINTLNIKEIFKTKQVNLIKDKIDVTSFMVWFVENYPQSFEKLKKEPDYQLIFKQ